MLLFPVFVLAFMDATEWVWWHKGLEQAITLIGILSHGLRCQEETLGVCARFATFSVKESNRASSCSGRTRGRVEAGSAILTCLCVIVGLPKVQ